MSSLIGGGNSLQQVGEEEARRQRRMKDKSESLRNPLLLFVSAIPAAFERSGDSEVVRSESAGKKGTK